MDGRALLARVRSRYDRKPVLVFTARVSLAERSDTLHEGADDFLRKPFVIEELEARLVALLCRSRGREHTRLALSERSLAPAAQRFMVAGQSLALSLRESAVLTVLVQRSVEPISTQQLPYRITQDDRERTKETREGKQ